MKETDALLKALAEGLKLMAKGIESVADQVNSLAKSQTLAKPGAAKKKAPKATASKKPARKAVKKPTPKTAARGKKMETAADTVMATIQKARGPVDNRKISDATGFETKKVANLLFQLKKQGRIKNVERGKYIAV
jgi:hypothetical protein